MKYRQLTKEQLAALHAEFATFLATQQIDVKEWEIMKQTKPEMAMDEINIFSDIVWEDVLTKTEYLDHFSDKYINLFKCNSKEMIRIQIEMERTTGSFIKDTDFKQFLKNPLDKSYNFFKASKKYKTDRNKELFDLIEMGAQISDGSLFKQIAQLIS